MHSTVIRGGGVPRHSEVAGGGGRRRCRRAPRGPRGVGLGGGGGPWASILWSTKLHFCCTCTISQLLTSLSGSSCVESLLRSGRGGGGWAPGGVAEGHRRHRVWGNLEGWAVEAADRIGRGGLPDGLQAAVPGFQRGGGGGRGDPELLEAPKKFFGLN